MVKMQNCWILDCTEVVVMEVRDLTEYAPKSGSVAFSCEGHAPELAHECRQAYADGEYEFLKVVPEAVVPEPEVEVPADTWVLTTKGSQHFELVTGRKKALALAKAYAAKYGRTFQVRELEA